MGAIHFTYESVLGAKGRNGCRGTSEYLVGFTADFPNPNNSSPSYLRLSYDVLDIEILTTD